ncbi:MAG: 30S ribosome-binding factor RbfA [bacterium]
MTEDISLRLRKIEALIQEEVSIIVSRKISDPDIRMVTITRVKLSSDLKFATIFISVLGTEDERGRALLALNRASARIQGLLGDSIRLKYTPHIRFVRDKGMESGERVMDILRELKSRGEL